MPATLIDGAHSAVRVLTSGVVGSLVSSAGGLIVSTVLAVFMLLFLLKDWAEITDWTAGHLGVPAETGHRILDGVVNAFRGYASGLTLIGAANAGVVGLGAWLLGVPLVGTIALVTFVTSYVPYLGAFVAGAFAVVIAYGSGGFSTALAMLAIVLLANNTIQNLLEPFAFGTRLPAASARRPGHCHVGHRAVRRPGGHPGRPPRIGRRERLQAGARHRSARHHERVGGRRIRTGRPLGATPATRRTAAGAPPDDSTNSRGTRRSSPATAGPGLVERRDEPRRR